MHVIENLPRTTTKLRALINKKNLQGIHILQEMAVNQNSA